MSSRATQCVSVLDVSTDLDLALDDLVGGSVVVACQAGEGGVAGRALQIPMRTVADDAVYEALHEVSWSFFFVGVEMHSASLAEDLDREDASLFFGHTNLK